MSAKIAFLPGDGVGPEVASAARTVMEKAAAASGLTLEFTEFDLGGIAIDRHGDPFPQVTEDGCKAADAILLGAIGGPKWDGGGPRPEQGLLKMRKVLNTFANLRPVTVMPGMEHHAPLKPELATGVDMLIVRELTGGLYFGDREEGDEAAWDRCDYSRAEVERVARIAFEAARLRSGRVTSVDKANVLATSRLWRKTVTALHQAEFSDVKLSHQLVDSMSMKLMSQPAEFDVIVTENLFGDILSDEASVVAGSIGLAPSASLSDNKTGIYEPIHGSAPDIAGQDKANPAGAILSGAMLLRYSLGEENAAKAIEAAVAKALETGAATGDLGGTMGTKAFTQVVCDALT